MLPNEFVLDAKVIQLIIGRGIQSSGKSTWAKELVKNSQGIVKRVNKDLLREMVDAGEWSREREKYIVSLRDTIIRSHLKHGNSVVVDDTNFGAAHINTFQNIAKEFNASLNIVDFPIDPVEAIKRDMAREATVGAKVIMETYLSNKSPYNWEGPQAATTTLPKAIIVDLDGTLAIKYKERHIYDGANCHMDTINFPVLECIDGMVAVGYKPIFCSGRDEKWRAQTEQFLLKCGFSGETLLMRPTGDNRCDTIIKKELYEKYIKGNYDVSFALDDRNRVVFTWRSLGIPCFQVEYGDF